MCVQVCIKHMPPRDAGKVMKKLGWEEKEAKVRFQAKPQPLC